MLCSRAVISPGPRCSAAPPPGRPGERMIRGSTGAALLVVGIRPFGEMVGGFGGLPVSTVCARARYPVIVVRGPGVVPADEHHAVVLGVDGAPSPRPP